jgi:CelD/BcsL family acetyltransferase involved in cellulose biosynthesis
LNARTEWDAALQRSKDNHVFLSWEWLSSWWKHYGQKREFFLVTVIDGDKILAAAPLMISRYNLYGIKLKKIEFIATPASDYHTFLLTDKKTDHVRMMLNYVEQNAMEWDCIELQEIPEDSETARILRIISKEPLNFEEKILTRCPHVFLPNKFEDFIKELSSSFRYNLHRYEKKLRKEFKVDFRICNDIEAVNIFMKIFFDLHQKRWQSQRLPGAFADKRFRDFHLDAARAFIKRGWLVLDFLVLNDEPRAAGYSFKCGYRLFQYLCGFDPQYSKYSIGNLRQMHILKYCIENSLKECDFMRGDEPYKVKWNTSIKRNLEFRAIKRGFVPIVYNWIRKNERLTYALGKHLSVR